MSAYRAVFTCAAGCHGEHSIWTPIYRCPKCGDLLQVTHDVTRLRDRSATDWMRLFEERYKRTAWP
jgi:threonine synthase